MRKIMFTRILIVMAALASGSLVAICFKGEGVKQREATAIDPTRLTLNAGTLPTVQINEPF